MPTVDANGAATYFARRGNGPPVVFVHGAMLDHSQWDMQVDALAADYDCIAYDVRGHGRSGATARRSYSVDLFADDLTALLDALDVEQPVLVGHSLGACIAQVYAAEHPERVAGLVLADAFTPQLNSRSEWLQRSLALRLAVYPVRLVGYQRVERALVWLQERLHGADVSGDYEAVRGLRTDGPTMTTAEFAKVARAVADFHETDVDLAAIAAPTLLLYGENEPPFIRAHAAVFADTIPDVEIRTVPDAGHAANLDNPAFVTDAVSEFLAKTGE